MLDRIANAPWWQITSFLSRGTPPLITQILGINTIFFILFMIRRMRNERALHREAAIQVQVLLIMSNVLVLFQEQIIFLMKKVT
jgi:hypothetical protein